jgi:hypothetical protein
MMEHTPEHTPRSATENTNIVFDTISTQTAWFYTLDAEPNSTVTKSVTKYYPSGLQMRSCGQVLAFRVTRDSKR